MSYKKNIENGEDNDWTSEEEFEDEGNRIDFYRRVCHGDDDYNEEELKEWANDRFKHKQGYKASAVYLPSLNSTANGLSATEEERVLLEEPMLNLPKGGWQIQQVHVAEESNELPSLMSSMLDLRPKKKLSGPRENAWKKMPNFFSDVGECTSSLPSAEFIPKKEETRNVILRNETEDDFKPAPSRSRERGERVEHRKPRLLPCSKRDDKPQFLKNTKMCKNGEQCGRRATCTFAHTLADFNPITCRFQERCNQKQTCTFKHDFETKEDYIKRLTNM
uniref:C3H1-type domain-containing protein n=1 Tax=viral metagenome TaxID=1070528 RepID=A0A6C0KRE7_9ZZZZ